MTVQPTRRPGRRVRVLAVSLALVLAACGGGTDAGPDADLVVIGTDRLTFEPATLTAQAGVPTSVALVCERGANHNLVIDGTGEQIAECTPGQTDFGVLTLDAGTYLYLCTVPGHEVTMRGTLEVR
jgi:plastocyanin